MPSRLPDRLALMVAGLLVTIPSPSIAQHYGGRGRDGGGYGYRGGGYGYRGGGYGYRGGGYGYRGGYGGHPAYAAYGGYVGYPRYAGYAGYPAYYGYPGYYGYHDHYNDAWIALGASIFGVMLGTIVAPRYASPYPYPPVAYAPPPQQQPQSQPQPQPQAAPVTPHCVDGSPIPAGGYCTAPQPAPPGPERG